MVGKTMSRLKNKASSRKLFFLLDIWIPPFIEVRLKKRHTDAIGKNVKSFGIPRLIYARTAALSKKFRFIPWHPYCFISFSSFRFSIFRFLWV
jgi:hypothetical protein